MVETATPSRVLEHIAQLRAFGAAIVKQADAAPAAMTPADCCLVPARIVKQLLNGLPDDDLLLVIDRPHVERLAKGVNARPGYAPIPGRVQPAASLSPAERPKVWPPAVLDGYAIKRWRMALAWTRKEFAERMGVSPKAVSDWETNEYQPSDERRERLLALMAEHPA